MIPLHHTDRVVTVQPESFVGDTQTTEVVVTDQHSAERLAHCTLQAGAIVVGDNGYGYRTSVATAVRQHADVVLRITPATFPVETGAGETFDLVAWLRQSDAAQQEWQGRCVHDAQHYAVHVLAARLPPEAVAWTHPVGRPVGPRRLGPRGHHLGSRLVSDRRLAALSGAVASCGP